MTPRCRWGAAVADCDQETCPFWTGSGCICEVVGLDEDDRNEQRRVLGFDVEEDDA